MNIVYIKYSKTTKRWTIHYNECIPLVCVLANIACEIFQAIFTIIDDNKYQCYISCFKEEQQLWISGKTCFRIIE